MGRFGPGHRSALNQAYGGMEERYRDSMAAKTFVEAVIDKPVQRKLREKHPRTINDVVKYAWMIEADKLREELWQGFDQGGQGEVQRSQIRQKQSY